MKAFVPVLFCSMLLALTACGGDSGNNSGGGDDNSSASLSSQTALSSGEEPTSSEQQGSSGVLSSGGTVSSSKGTSSNAVPGSSVAKSSVGGTSSSSSVGGVSSSSGDVTSFTDPRDGQVYPVVRIGTQVWFAKNLNVGTMVEWDGSEDVFTVSTDDTKIEKLCYGNNPANCDLYGGLYEFIEAMGFAADCEDMDWIDPVKCPIGNLPTGKQGICPDGWHIPDTTEFRILFQYVHDNGYTSRENIALRDQSLHSGLDAFGFSVLGGGYVRISADWIDITQEGYLWSSTIGSTDFYPRSENWDSNDDFIVIHDQDKAWSSYGLSIRCLQD